MLKIYIICVIIGLIPLVQSKCVQFYRKDYTYIEKYDAHYKVHWDIYGSSWSSAFNMCYKEGAKMFYPEGDEWTIIKNLTDAMPSAPNNTEIYVGLHDEFNLGQFITIDGKPTESPLNEENNVMNNTGYRCILMDYITGQFRVSDCNADPDILQIIPFVCKKVDDESCPTIDSEYKYEKSSTKCYKVNKIPKTWQAAMETCFMEGGVLAIVESAADIPNWALEALIDNQHYFLGFRRMFSLSDFYTIRGKKYESDNFNYYQTDSPDHECGVMLHTNNNNFRIEVRNCYVQLPFICEMMAK